MKKFKFLAFALFAVLACVSFVSCSDDDDKPANNSIVGTWFEERTEEYYTVYEECTFKEDGTMTFYWRQTIDGVADIDTNVGRYRLVGDELTLWWDNQEEEVKRTVVIEGNRMTLSWTAEVDGTPVLKTRVYQRK